MVMNEQEVAAEPRWKTSGPPYLLTRDELLQELRSSGYVLSDRRVRDWVTQNIIPRPTRRLPAHATDGIARSMYPAFMVAVIKDLLGAELSNQATTREELRQIASRLIPYWQKRYGDAPEVRDATAQTSTQTLQTRALSASASVASTSSVTAKATVAPRPARRLRLAVWGYASRFAERNTSRVTEATLMLKTEDGTVVSIPIHPASSSRQTTE